MRRWLIGVAIATTSMVAIAFLVPMGFLIRDFARQTAIRNADRDTSAIGPILAATLNRDDVNKAIDAMALPPDRLVVFKANGEPMVGGEPASFDLAHVLKVADDKTAASEKVPGGIATYTPIYQESDIVVVRVFIPSSELSRGVNSALTAIAALAVLLVTLAVVVADRLAMSISRPVASLASAARQLGQGDLTTRVDPNGPPEVAEVATAFNGLASRVTELLAAERELVADLSHRLRTPLTALRLDVDALADGAAAERVREDVDAVQNTVDELIREARRPLRSAGGVAVGDLAAVVRERMTFWAALAEEQERQWFWTGTERAAKVNVSESELEAAVDALLNNAFAHTPEGTAVRAWLEVREDAVTLVVDDDGPGFPAFDVIERGRSSVGSTGLGLDIVRRTAEAVKGTLRVSSRPSGGGRVEVRFPLAT
ncbi:MAG: sensor histidine kinase [Acidimicrobiia bacterium]